MLTTASPMWLSAPTRVLLLASVHGGMVPHFAQPR